MAKRKNKKTIFTRFIDWLQWSRVRVTLIILAWLVVFGGLFAGLIVGVPALETYAAERTMVEQYEVVFLDKPQWVEDDLLTQLSLTVRQMLQTDPFENADLTRARRALLETGWFRNVEQVRRIGNGVVEVSAEFATRYALVRDRDGDHLVDPQGRLLPRMFPREQKKSVAVIVGVGLDRPRDFGKVWPGADIAAGLAMLRLIYPQPWKQQVEFVDVSGYARDGAVSLITDNGCRIIWGHPPGDDSAAEPPTAQKTQYLTYFYENFDRIDRGYTTVIDIRGEVVTLDEQPPE